MVDQLITYPIIHILKIGLKILSTYHTKYNKCNTPCKWCTKLYKTFRKPSHWQHSLEYQQRWQNYPNSLNDQTLSILSTSTLCVSDTPSWKLLIAGLWITVLTDTQRETEAGISMNTKKLVLYIAIRIRRKCRSPSPLNNYS
jgi:hypothetical protein